MSDASTVNTRYGNISGMINPVFQSTIDGLVKSKLYGEKLLSDPTTLSLTTSGKQISECIFISESPLGNDAVPLDVLVDVITKSVLKGLQDGFEQNGIHKSAAYNIDIKLSPLPALNTMLVSNVHDAISILAQEISAIKSTISMQAPIGIPLPTDLTHKVTYIEHQ